MTAPVLGDALGPRARRRAAIASVAVAAVMVGAAALAANRLADKGQLDGSLWKPFTTWRGSWRYLLLTGLKNTLKAAGAAMGLAMVVGTVMALGRLSRRAPVRWLAGAYVEFFRSVPLLLLILFSYLGLPRFGVRLPLFGYLVLALVVYNGAILGEIFRAGILSLDRGQTEAAHAVGLSYTQTMAFVLVPQGLRRMVPAVVSQLVTLLKDTSLGLVISYEDLLGAGKNSGEFYGNVLQTYAVVAAVYIVVNFSLGRLARRLEVRQRRRYRAGALGVSGVEDLAVVEASAEAHLR